MSTGSPAPSALQSLPACFFTRPGAGGGEVRDIDEATQDKAKQFPIALPFTGRRQTNSDGLDLSHAFQIDWCELPAQNQREPPFHEPEPLWTTLGYVPE